MALTADDERRLREAFSAPAPAVPPKPSAGRRESAVLIAVFETDRGPGLLYTRRAESLSSHAGEVSFPGGRVDATDASALDAALREAEEEVGLSRKRVTVLGHVTDKVTFYGAMVRAYAALAEGSEVPGPVNADEVAEAFIVPVEDLLDPRLYESRAVEGSARAVHYFRVKPRTVWGITGDITVSFLQRAYGWKPTGRTRTISTMEEFIPDE